jgi:hypothetical protein
MKKVIIIASIVAAVCVAAAYIFYTYYLPGLMAQAIVAEEIPGYVPRHIRGRIAALREPVNKGAGDVVAEMRKADIPMEKIFSMIDNTTEAQAYSMLEELNGTKLTSTDQVFDIAKKYFPAEFDIEVLRKPFNENLNMKMIKKGIRFGNTNRKTKDVDIEIVKALAKEVLHEKEQELRVKN